MSYTDPQIGTLTMTGNPARFVATERVPVSGISMDFEPVQDLHGYEYPWPGGGGKNLICPRDVTYTNYSASIVCSKANETITITGTATGSGGRYLRLTNVVTLPPGTYVLSKKVVSGTIQASYIINNAANDAFIGGTSFTLTEETSVYLGVNVANGTTYNETVHIQLEKGSKSTAWNPYENICPITGRDSVTVYVSPEPAVVDGTEEYEIEFGQTVYEGNLTINEDGSGTIVSTVAYLENSNKVARYNGTDDKYFWHTDLAQLGGSPIKDANAGLLCIRLKAQPALGDVSPEGTIAVFINGIVRWKEQGAMSLDEYKDYLAANPLSFCYELAEPVTIQLDPIEITTLIGLNYVWTSDNNLITITFPYNKEVQPMSLNYEHCWTYPKAYIDKLEARIAALETAAAAAAAEANTAAVPADTRETVAEEITVTEEPETEPVTKKGGK